MRVLGLDIGEVRIGVALSDASESVATPLAVLDAKQELRQGVELPRLVDEYQVSTIVVGLPLSLDGSEGPQAERVRRAAGRLAGFLRVPLEFFDERLSSSAAERVMAEAGATSRDRRGSVDMVAAAIILQGYLDARRTSADATQGAGPDGPSGERD